MCSLVSPEVMIRLDVVNNECVGIISTRPTCVQSMLAHAGNVFLWDRLEAAPGQLPAFFLEVARPASVAGQQPENKHSTLALPRAAAASSAAAARGAEVLNVLAALARDIIGGEVLNSAPYDAT